MSSVNKVIILGRLGKDPQLDTLDDGSSVVNFSVATADGYKDKSGEWQEKTDWHQIKAWGKLADNCDEYLEKGSLVYLEGKLKTSSWEDESGETRYSTHVKATDVTFLPSNLKEKVTEEE